MKIILPIFAGLEKLAYLVDVDDVRFESGDSRFSWEKKFFHPPAYNGQYPIF
jgi:hypothetical protein